MFVQLPSTTPLIHHASHHQTPRLVNDTNGYS